MLVKVRAVHLYAAFLGGPVADGRMGEDHEVVFVIADDPIEAKSKAKDKWSGVGRGHVDAVQRVEVVDGFAISCQRGATKAAPSPSFLATTDPPQAKARLLDAVTPRHCQGQHGGVPEENGATSSRARTRPATTAHPKDAWWKLGRNVATWRMAVGRSFTGVKKATEEAQKEHECRHERIGRLSLRRHEPDEDAQCGEGERASPTLTTVSSSQTPTPSLHSAQEQPRQLDQHDDGEDHHHRG